MCFVSYLQYLCLLLTAVSRFHLLSVKMPKKNKKQASETVTVFILFWDYPLQGLGNKIMHLTRYASVLSVLKNFSIQFHYELQSVKNMMRLNTDPQLPKERPKRETAMTTTTFQKIKLDDFDRMTYEWF